MAKHVTVRFGGGDAPVSPFRVAGYAEVPLAVVPTDVIATADRIIGSAAVPVPDQPNDDTAYPENVVRGTAAVYKATPGSTGTDYAPRTTVWFTEGSYWRTPLPTNATIHPNSANILHYIAVDGDTPSTEIRFAATSWTMPVYWAKPGDKEYNVPWTGYPSQRPTEHNTMRIPTGATPAATSDGAMVVYDVQRGYVTSFHQATYNNANDTWSTSGGSFAYLASNGLDNRVKQTPWHEGSDDSRNSGSLRGNNGVTMYVSWEQVKAAADNGGDLGHIFKHSLASFFREDFIAPTIGSDGKLPTSSPWYSVAPKNGTRMRIKPSVTLTGHGLTNAELAIARTLQRYGMYVGDSSNSSVIKLEDLSVRDDLVPTPTWASIGITTTSMDVFPFLTAWEVIDETYWP